MEFAVGGPDHASIYELLRPFIGPFESSRNLQAPARDV